MKLGKLIDVSKSNNSQESFQTFLKPRAEFQVPFNLETCSNCSITNYVKFPVFQFFENVNKVELKMIKIDC